MTSGRLDTPERVVRALFRDKASVCASETFDVRFVHENLDDAGSGRRNPLEAQFLAQQHEVIASLGTEVEANLGGALLRRHGNSIAGS